MIGINTDFIHALSDESAPNAQLLQLTAKLTEEVGELQAAALVRTDCKNASASAEDNLEEEAVDVLINCFDILFYCGYDNAMIQAMMDKKCSKWQAKLIATNT